MVGLLGLDAKPANAKILQYIENVSQKETFIIVSILLYYYYLFGYIL